MAIRATHVATGTEICLGSVIDVATESLVRQLHRRCSAGVLECREHDTDPKLAHLRDSIGQVHGIWVYIRWDRGRWRLCHHAGGEDHIASAGKSEAHQRRQDYWERAGQDVGYETAQEKRLTSGVRLDVAIVGPAATIGVEVQRSSLAASQAVDRTRKAREAGVTSVWSAEQREPPWAYRVPHIETNELPDGVAPRGSWTVVDGPKSLEPQRCHPVNFDRCPATGRGVYCSEFHPTFAPITGLCVDDVAERAPAGDLVPLYTGRRRGVLIVSAADKQRYDELVGDQALNPRSPSRGSPSGPCSYDVDPERLIAGTTARPSCQSCGQPLRLVRSDHTVCERCRLHPPFILVGHQYALDVSRLIAPDWTVDGGP